MGAAPLIFTHTRAYRVGRARPLVNVETISSTTETSTRGEVRSTTTMDTDCRGTGPLATGHTTNPFVARELDGAQGERSGGVGT